MVRALRPVSASPNSKLSTVPEMELLKRQRSLIYTHLCQKGEKWPNDRLLFERNKYISEYFLENLRIE